MMQLMDPLMIVLRYKISLYANQLDKINSKAKILE